MSRLSYLAVVGCFASLLMGIAGPAVGADDDVWPGVKSELFGTRPVLEDGLATLEAPGRADDAAIVPVTVRLPAGSQDVRRLILVVEKNPAPMAATFTFGPAAGTGERVIQTRLRFDMYSNLRAIVELADGSLHMTTRFVKAAGGCSAPALKDADEALALIGKTIIRDVSAVDGRSDVRTGLVMVRHPNYSGMQMNQLTGYYIPAKYVTGMTVRRGVETVFDLDAGISLSEDPNIRFTFAAKPNEPLSVTTSDSDGRTFTGEAGQSGS